MRVYSPELKRFQGADVRALSEVLGLRSILIVCFVACRVMGLCEETVDSGEIWAEDASVIPKVPALYAIVWGVRFRF